MVEHAAFPVAQRLTIFVGAQELPENVLGRGGPAGYGYSHFGQGFDDAIQELDTNDVFKPFAGMLTLSTEEELFYFGLEDNVTEGKFDFFSVVLHEVGHILGIGTTDAWASRIDSNGNYMGANVVAIVGSEGVKTAPNHLDDGYLMDPALYDGVRLYLSQVEYGILYDLGYVAIPEPSSALVFLTGGILVTAFRRKKAG